MTSDITITNVKPTVFLRERAGSEEQLARVTVANAGDACPGVFIGASGPRSVKTEVERIPEGESLHDIFVPVITQPADIEVALKVSGTVLDTSRAPWRPPRRWVAHLVQRSHHDAGYTDLPSRELRNHFRYLDAAIDMAVSTRDFPEDARFRLTVEQAWSLDHFFRNAPPERANAMGNLLREGTVEVTALFGNMTTELCGHEELARLLYPAFRIGQRYGVKIVSAEHNDITGLSWGLCEALVQAGIRVFLAGIPNFYNWGEPKLRPSWDPVALVCRASAETHAGASASGPGAFWWKAPSGGRVLFWHNAMGAGGPAEPALQGLGDWLFAREKEGYPYTAIRYPVAGGSGDNSPYTDRYAHTVKKWNEQWISPRLVCSTNKRFYEDLVTQLPDDLPVFHGEMPGQDFPAGAMSFAAATATNRAAHSAIPTAEKLAAMADALTDYEYQKDILDEAFQETLWHDEHTWGFHFPCGPACDTSESEKAVHAFRAASLAHGVANHAMAHIADGVALSGDYPYLVVFNSVSAVRTNLLRVPLREFDNACARRPFVPVAEDGKSGGIYAYFKLADRSHPDLPPDYFQGKFDLVDCATGETVPFQIAAIDDANTPVPHAGQRLGIGSGTRRCAVFEIPVGVRLDLCFVANDVPACGFKTYALRPRKKAARFENGCIATDLVIENEYYRIEADGKGIISIRDRTLDCELVDINAPHRFGELVVRTPLMEESTPSRIKVRQGDNGPVETSLVIESAAPGHPLIMTTLSLAAGLKQISVAVRVLKDPTPLLDVGLAFPFNLKHVTWRYEAGMSVVRPIDDFLPGAYMDRVTVQDWLTVSDGKKSIVWSSLDSPVASLGQFWEGYTSNAHACLLRPDIAHDPQTKDDITQGYLYSLLFANNFGTNFSASQTGSVLFRYVFSSRPGEITSTEGAAFGRGAITPFTHILTTDAGNRTLSPQASFMAVDNDAVTLLACKRAENGRGLIVRLWNVSDKEVSTRVSFPFISIKGARLTNIVEDDLESVLPHDSHSVMVHLGANAVGTVRVEQLL